MLRRPFSGQPNLLRMLPLLLVAFGFSLASSPPQTEPNKTIDQYGQRSWRMEDGLPDNTIRDIAQTNDGYLWLAANSGLVRFDGASFTVFNMKNVPAMINENVYTLCAAHDGGLWVGLQAGGLLYYRDNRFRAYLTQDGLSGNWVSALHEDDSGTLWVGTDGNRLSLLRNGNLTSQALPVEETGGISDIFQDRSGRIWIADQNGHLFCWEGERFRIIHDDAWKGGSVLKLAEGPDGALWMGTWSGLISYRGGIFTRHGGQSKEDIVKSLLFDRAGTLWVGSEQGLYHYPEDPGSLGSAPVISRAQCLFQDKEGSIWAGTYSAGLTCFRDGPVTAWTVKQGLSADFVRSVLEAEDGTLWVGSFERGLNRYRDGQWSHFSSADGLPSDRIWSICQDREGALWLGTGNGLVRYEAGEERFDHGQRWLEGTEVRFVFEDRSGVLWVGLVGGGLLRFQDGVFVPYTEAEGMASNHVRGILQDQDGSFWVTSEHGLTHLQGEGKTVYTYEDGLPNDWIVSIYQDKDGNLWLGTYGGGLCRFRDGTFTTYTKEQGLFTNNAWAILEDEEENLWMSCDLGIYRVNRNDLDRLDAGVIDRVPCYHLGLAQGLKRLECNGGGFPAAYRDRQGLLWFASMGGPVAVDPTRMTQYSQPPPVIVERLIVDNLDSSEITSVIPAGKRDFSIEFTALTYLNSDQIRFRYTLEGYDNRWIDAGNRRTAWFTNIAPGAYTFRVQAVNYDGIWGEASAAFDLSLEPYFYQTIWFYLFLTIVTTGLVVGLHRLRMIATENKTRRDHRALEAEVAARTAELGQKNQELENLDSIVKTINREVELKDVMEAILEQGLAHFVRAESGIFLVFDRDRGVYCPFAAAGVNFDQVEMLTYGAAELEVYLNTLPRPEEGIYIINDMDESWMSAQDIPRPRSVLVMGIPHPDKPQSLLCLANRKSSHAFQHAQVCRLRRFREHAIMAVHKAEVMRDLILAQGKLVQNAHLSGMAEIAGEVLHNVGNRMNSINIGVSVLKETLVRKHDWQRVYKKTLDKFCDEQGGLPEERRQNYAGLFERIHLTMKKQNWQLGDEINNLAENLEHVITSLLQQDRHVQQTSLFLKDTDLNGLIEDTLHAQNYFLGKKELEVIRDFGVIPPVLVEPNKMSRILNYLIENAWEAIEEKNDDHPGQIIIATRMISEEVHLEVSDNGIGIVEQNITHLFRDGYTTKPTSRGFGLHYCANSMKEMSGSMDIRSDGFGKGAAVDLLFNVAQ